MRVTISFVMGLVLTLIMGCSFLPGQNKLYSDYGVGVLTVDKDSASVKLKEAITKSSDKNPAGIVDLDCFNVPVDGTKDSNKTTSCQQQRNAAIVTLMSASDDMCQEHLKTIFGNDASFNIITGTFTNLAAGAATGASGLVAKTALAGIAFFSNAERSLLNETVYKNLLVTAVSSKIREARESKANVMIPGNFEKSINTYPMLLAMHDVLGYHYTCSFMFGLEKALKEGTETTMEARKIKLEQERQSVDIQLTAKTKALKDAKKTDAEIDKDKDISGLRDRLGALDAELVNMTKVQK